MAAIVTIHGTFASAEERGQEWWQRGSDFEREISTFVEAEDGSLEFQPFIWTPSLNSETKRRAAATELLQKLRNSVGPRSYAVIAHSHGGSIAAIAARESERTGSDLPGLSTLITVASPFLTLGKRRWLVSRLDTPMQFIYIVLASYFAMAALVLAAELQTHFDRLYILFTAATLLPPVAVHLYFAWLDRRRYAIYAASLHSLAGKRFGGKFLPLWHTSDEVIGALKSVPQTRFHIFQPAFLLGSIVVAYMALLPVLTFFILSLIGRLCPDQPPPGESQLCPVEMPSWWLKPFYDGFWLSHNYFGKYLSLQEHPLLIIVAAYMISLGVFALLALAGLTGLRKFGPFGTGVIATFLNGKVNRAVVETTYGNDDRALTATACSPIPFDTVPFAPLPTELQDLLSAYADTEASKTLGKLRTVVGDLIANVGSAKGMIIDEYLTWSELIHTSYFEVPLFRKLVCYAIAHSPGFRPSDALRADPDYEKLGRWLETIHGARSPAEARASRAPL